MKKLFLFLIVVNYSLFSQVTTDELNKTNLELISNSFLLEEDDEFFNEKPSLSFIAIADNKKNWVTKKPKKGNGFGKYKFANLTYECNTWKDYKLNGKVKIYYKNVLYFEGSANNGALIDGNLYRYFNYALRKQDADASANGTYKMLKFKGELNFKKTYIGRKGKYTLNIYNFGKGLIFKINNRLEYTVPLHIPEYESVKYSERLYSKKAGTSEDGKTLLFKNIADYKQPSKWRLLFEYTVKDTYPEGEFIDYEQFPEYIKKYNNSYFSKTQPKYFVKSFYKDKQLLKEKTQVVDSETLEQIDFNADRIVKNNDGWNTYTYYYNDEMWNKYLDQIQSDKESVIRRKKNKIKYQEEQYENDRLDAIKRAKELENRWTSAGTYCSKFELPGKIRYERRTCQPVNVSVNIDGGSSDSMRGLSLWYDMYETLDVVTNSYFVAAHSANYLNDENAQNIKSGEYLIAYTLANAIFPSSTFEQSLNNKNINWTIEFENSNGNALYTKYYDNNGNVIYVYAERCDTAMDVRIVCATYDGIKNTKEFKRFMFR